MSPKARAKKLVSREKRVESSTRGSTMIYGPPSFVVWAFYGLLFMWTALSIGFIVARGDEGVGGDLFWLTMIGFVLGFTWYFSLGISYRVEMKTDGGLELTSFRRVLHLRPEDIRQLEPPFLPWGFLRLKLEREKAYVFCSARSAVLQSILKRTMELNPEIKLRMQ